MKIYMMTDLEGVGGVWDWDRGGWTDEDRARARRLLTGEVNAAVEGFLEGGADGVIVNDGHGRGYSIDIEDVHPAATVIHGVDRPFWLPDLDETCDATALVGAHAKARTPGANLCHSMSGSIDGYWVNDVSIGEIGLQALIAGHFGVPFIFLSGDEHACREVSELIPSVGTTATKRGLSTLSAHTLSPAACRERIREGAESSVELIGTVKPLTLGTPLVFRERRVKPDFDEGGAGEGERIISRWEREITAADPIELTCRVFGYELPSG
jgi:D-amino peptidase